MTLKSTSNKGEAGLIRVKCFMASLLICCLWDKKMPHSCVLQSNTTPIAPQDLWRSELLHWGLWEKTSEWSETKQTVFDSVISPVPWLALLESAWCHMTGHLSAMTPAATCSKQKVSHQAKHPRIKKKKTLLGSDWFHILITCENGKA